jgi:hypothetical protein
VKKIKLLEKRAFARKDGSLGETLERHLLYVNSRASRVITPKTNYRERLPSL